MEKAAAKAGRWEENAMKKLIALLCLTALLLTGCAAKPAPPSGDAQTAAFDETTRALTPALDPMSVAACAYHRNHETAQTYQVADSDAIRSLCAALANVRVGEAVDEAASDYDDIFAFTLSDGQIVTFTFNQHNFALNGQYYAVSSDEKLWTLAEELAQSAD